MTGSRWHVDHESEEPIFEQLVVQVQDDVVDKRLAPGDRLPSASQVATELGVNQHTVLAGYRRLQSQGLVVIQRHFGTSIRSDVPKDIERLESLVEELVAVARLSGLGTDYLVFRLRRHVG